MFTIATPTGTILGRYQTLDAAIRGKVRFWRELERTGRPIEPVTLMAEQDGVLVDAGDDERAEFERRAVALLR